MIIYDVESCDYCKSTIAASQRWVREKTYDPRSIAKFLSTTTITPNSSVDRKEAVGKNTKSDSEIARTTVTATKWEAVRSESRGRLQVIKL